MFRFLFFLGLLCVACHKKESASSLQTVRLSISSEPASLDPRRARHIEGVNILRMAFEGLTRMSSNGELELGIAKEVIISEDGLRYEFRLRPSFWSDGTALISDDFAISWKAILDPKFPTDISYYLYPIKNAKKVKTGEISVEELGIEHPDPHTLIITLEHPTPYFLELVSLPSFFPVPTKIASANASWAFEAETFVSNGPFMMKSWSHTDQVTLVKNPQYWNAKEIHLDQIDLIVASPDTALRMFEEEKIDWVGSPLNFIPINAVKELKVKKQLNICPFLATSFLRINTANIFAEKQNPLSHSSLRKALALSLDRQVIVEHILQGGQKPAKSFVPPEMGLSKEDHFSLYDLEEAKYWLEKAKSEIGFPLSAITISYFNTEQNVAIAQALQKQWEENLKIPICIEAVELKVYFQRISRGEFQLALGSWTADFNDPINFLEVFKYKENGINNTGWENPQYIDLLNRSQLCKDLEERKQLLREAESILMDQMPLIPIYHYALNYLKRDDLDGVVLSPLGHLDLKGAQWELGHPSLQKR